ncbi:hypothetical protein [Nannocystis pusilla]|uniref:hypothetical protein n=1 Tax=Nannocystis pusilla TaxID=889268 RepID=UPI003DA6B1CA
MPLSDDDGPLELVGGGPEVGLDDPPLVDPPLVDPLVVVLAVVESGGSPDVPPPVVLAPDGALQATIAPSSKISR